MSGRFERGQAVPLRTKPAEDVAVFPCRLALASSGDGAADRLLLCSRAQIVELSTVDQDFVSRVLSVHEMVGLFKINIKKTGKPVLRIQFKSDATLCYYMPKAVECVAFIKQQMASLGVQGTVTKGKTNARAIESAQAFFDQFFLIEKRFTLTPRVDLVRDVMDLLREATERFSEASDERYLSVVQQTKSFLARPDVDALLRRAWAEEDSKGAPAVAKGASYDSEEEASHNSAFSSSSSNDNKKESSSSSSIGKAREGSSDSINDDVSRDLLAAMAATNASSDSFDDGSARDVPVVSTGGGGDDGLSAELDGLLGDMATEFSSLLESYGCGGEGEGGEFDMDEFEELMQSHGVHT